MMIDIHLLGYLAKFSPTKQEKFKLDLHGESTVSRLLEEIKFPVDLESVILVNGSHGSRSTKLSEGDEVFIFIPAPGG
jgi:molybdopterin converting factor small subunit